MYLKIDTFIMRILYFKKLGTLFRGLIPIPCWNYTGIQGIDQNPDSLLTWAIMDTFDALGAKYDKPLSLSELKQIGNALSVTKFEIKKGGNGLVFNGEK